MTLCWRECKMSRQYINTSHFTCALSIHVIKSHPADDIYLKGHCDPAQYDSTLKVSVDLMLLPLHSELFGGTYGDFGARSRCLVYAYKIAFYNKMSHILIYACKSSYIHISYHSHLWNYTSCNNSLQWNATIYLTYESISWQLMARWL